MGSFISRDTAMASSRTYPPPPPPLAAPRYSRFASLPPDILISILDCLTLVVDRIRFGSVCSSFLSAFKSHQYSITILSSSSSSLSSSTLPWILLPNKSTDTNMAFFSITERKMYNIPQLRSPPDGNHHYLWLGSSRGWLVGMDQGTSLISLVNPLTRSHIPLPPLVRVDDESSPKLLCLEFSKAILSWNYTTTTCSSSSSSSSSEKEGYAVVLLLAWRSSNWPSTMLCARGDRDKIWIPFGSGRDTYTDAAFHNGQCYAMQYNGSVEAWDLSTRATPLLTVIVPSSSPQKLFLSSTRYLVGSGDGILHVFCRSSSSSAAAAAAADLSEIDFKIFKLDLSNILEYWVEMESLELDRNLFLSRYCSMSTRRNYNHSEFEACSNCIYFDNITPGKEWETLVLMREGEEEEKDGRSLKKILHHGSYWNPSPICIQHCILVRKEYSP